MKLWARLHGVMFPPSCRWCGHLLDPFAPIPGYPYVCAPCLAALPWATVNAYCPQCQTAMSHAPQAQCCANQDLARVWAVFSYAEPLEKWIHRMKYGGEDVLVGLFGALMAQAPFGAAPGGAAQWLVPVPLHLKRLRWRGFNQSLLLARAWQREILAQGQAAPQLAPHWLGRHRHTRPQMELGRDERHANVQQAFSVPAGVATNGAVLLVDDVLTTGATLHACARVLRQSGVTRVEALVLARA